MHCCVSALVFSGMLACRLSAATVIFDIQPDGLSGTNAVVVEPGQDVPYILTAIVTSDDPINVDNNGLAFFRVHIRTDLGVTQRPVDEFEPIIGENFTIQQNPGTPLEPPGSTGELQDIEQISGAVNTFVGLLPVFGIAQNEQQILARGRLATPNIEGDFSAIVRDDSTANVFQLPDNRVVTANIAIGTGMRISTRVSTGGGGGSDDGNGSDGTGGTNGVGGSSGEDTGGITLPTATQPATPLGEAVALTVGLGALVAGALLWGGPLLGMAALLLAPIIGILIVLASRAAG